MKINVLYEPVGGSGGSLSPLTFGSGMNSGTYDGSQPVTISINGSSLSGSNNVAMRNENGNTYFNSVGLSILDQNTISGAMAFRVNETTDSTLKFCNDITSIKTYLELNNVDNTDDNSKPISIAVQTALSNKAPLASPNFSGDVTRGNNHIPVVYIGPSFTQPTDWIMGDIFVVYDPAS